MTSEILEGVRRAGDGKIELIIESTRTVTVKMEEEFIAKIDEFLSLIHI